MSNRIRTKEVLWGGAGLMLALGLTACNQNTDMSDTLADAPEWRLEGYTLVSAPTFEDNRVTFNLEKSASVYDGTIYCKDSSLMFSSDVLQSAFEIADSPVCGDNVATQHEWDEVLDEFGISVLSSN